MGEVGKGVRGRWVLIMKSALSVSRRRGRVWWSEWWRGRFWYVEAKQALLLLLFVCLFVLRERWREETFFNFYCG